MCGVITLSGVRLATTATGGNLKSAPEEPGLPQYIYVALKDQSGNTAMRSRGWDLASAFRTAVPFWGQFTQISSSLSPKRDWGSKGVNTTHHINSSDSNTINSSSTRTTRVLEICKANGSISKDSITTPRQLLAHTG